MKIFLIGPMASGKSTTAVLLANKLELPHYPLDDLRWDYYAEIGYDEAEAKRIWEAGGPMGIIDYWKKFEPHAVERVVQIEGPGVIDFGAGHSVYEDEAQFERVAQALAPIPFVILLLPSPDVETSYHMLSERLGELTEDTRAYNRHFLTHPSNGRLAKHTIYTDGKTPEAVCEEIADLVRR